MKIIDEIEMSHFHMDIPRRRLLLFSGILFVSLNQYGNLQFFKNGFKL